MVPGALMAAGAYVADTGCTRNIGPRPREATRGKTPFPREPPAAAKQLMPLYFFFSSRRRHTRLQGDWSSDVCSSDLTEQMNSLSAFLLKLNSDNATSLLNETPEYAIEGAMVFEHSGCVNSHRVNGNGKIGRASCRERV